MNVLSSAGNWLFCFRRWRNPHNIEDLEALEREYVRLCSAFPRFAAACSKERFLSCIASVYDSWAAKIPAMAQNHPSNLLHIKSQLQALPVGSALPQAAGTEATVAAEPSDAAESFEDVLALWEPCSAEPGCDCVTFELVYADADGAAELEGSCGSSLRGPAA